MDENEIMWHKRFLKQAEDVAEWSKGFRTRVGVVIYDDTKTPINNGFNGFPRGVDESITSRHEKPEKYLYTEHAERNAIYNCARNGVSTNGKIMYITLHPCAPCARGIIQSGIKKVIIPANCVENLREEVFEKYRDDFEAARAMFDEAGVEFIFIV
jgi:dCMP deaminase